MTTLQVLSLLLSKFRVSLVPAPFPELVAFQLSLHQGWVMLGVVCGPW